MSRQQHRFYGDPRRFDTLAAFIHDLCGSDVTYIADVAGGQGMLARILNKRYNYRCEVIDPRGWTLKGVPSRAEAFDPSMADYYDLIVGCHADQALRLVAEAALIRPTILIPCCNFWSAEKLGQEELLQAIESYYSEHGVSFQRTRFAFKGPKNIGFVTESSQMTVANESA